MKRPFRASFALCAFLLVLSLPLSAQVRTSPQPEKKFLVKKIEVIGSTLLSPPEIRGLVSPYEGQDLDLESLARLASEITLLYKKKGYLLARAYVPPQEIENGVAQILVVEGKIGEIKIEGNQAYSTRFLEYYLKPALENRSLQYERLEKALLLLNEFPDLRVRSFLKPGKEPGTSDLILRVSDKTPLHEVVDYNNFGNRFVGENRAGLEVFHGNLTGRGDLLDLRAVQAFPSSQSPFFQFSYGFPISPSGTKISFSYASADIKVGQELQVLDIRGSANIYGLTLAHPLERTAAVSSNLRGSFYLKNVRNFIFGGTLTSRDKLRHLVFGYDRRWSTSATRDFLSLSATQGLGTWLGGMGRNDPLASRVGADNSFTKLNGDLVHLHRVFQDHFVILRGHAQWALSPLTVTEQYSVGGPDSVRGYEQSEILGDSAWNLGAELRLALTDRKDPNPIQAAFFVDTGFASLRNPLPGETAKRHLTGAGFGVRATLWGTTAIRLDLGFPMDPSRNSRRESPLFYAQFATQF